MIVQHMLDHFFTLSADLEAEGSQTHQPQMPMTADMVVNCHMMLSHVVTEGTIGSTYAANLPSVNSVTLMKCLQAHHLSMMNVQV